MAAGHVPQIDWGNPGVEREWWRLPEQTRRRVAATGNAPGWQQLGFEPPAPGEAPPPQQYSGGTRVGFQRGRMPSNVRSSFVGRGPGVLAGPNDSPLPQNPANSPIGGDGASAPVVRLPGLPQRSTSFTPQPFSMPGAVSPDRVNAANDALGRGVNIRTPGRESLGAAPSRVSGFAGTAPLSSANPIQALIDLLEQGTRVGSPGERANLAGPAGDNQMEQLSQQLLQLGFDPGQQYEGRDVRRERFTPAQINQMAQQRAEPVLRAWDDIERLANQSAGRGGYADARRADATRARGMVEMAGARQAALRDAQLDAASQNAQQEQIWSDQGRNDFMADINSRVALGQLGLERAGLAGGLGQQRRALDQARDIAGYQGDITQRGQDLQRATTEAQLQSTDLQAALAAAMGLRGQDLQYVLGEADDRLAARGQDVTQRGQDIDRSVAAYQGGIAQRGQDIDAATNAAQLNNARDLARAGNEGDTLRSLISQTLGLGQINLGARGQDIDAGLRNRQLDIQELLGRAQLGLGGAQIQADLQNAAAERQTRLVIVQEQLRQQNLDLQTRAQLDRERQQLQREITELQLAQQESQFARTYSEDQRQFDSTQEFRGDQAGLDRDFQADQAQLGRDFQRAETDRSRVYDQQLRRQQQLEQQQREARQQRQDQQLQQLLAQLMAGGYLQPPTAALPNFN